MGSKQLLKPRGNVGGELGRIGLVCGRVLVAWCESMPILLSSSAAAEKKARGSPPSAEIAWRYMLS